MVIDVRGLTKTFETGRRRSRRRIEAVRDISFSVEAGERVAYIGPNGACRSQQNKRSGQLTVGLSNRAVLGAPVSQPLDLSA